MRHLVIVASLLLVPGAAIAQTAEPQTVSRDGSELSGHRMLAIAVGAVVGVIVANGLTGGMATPILLAGTGGTPLLAAAAAEPAVAVVQAGIIIVGGVVGGYVGDWIYGN